MRCASALRVSQAALHGFVAYSPACVLAFLRDPLVSAVSVGFVVDPLSELNLVKDSTVAMMSAAQRRGWQLSYMLQEHLFWRDGQAMAFTAPVELSAEYVETRDPFNLKRPWYRDDGDIVEKRLADFDVLFMRKDPPFDMDYVFSTYFLDHAVDSGVQVINRPSSLRDCNEKFYSTHFPELLPPTLVSQDPNLLFAFHSEHGDVIYKCLDGMGGRGIFRVLERDRNLGVVIETLTKNGTRQIMAQCCIPEISEGDKRILLIDGEAVPYALARIPPAGDNRGNLAVGASGVGVELSDRDREISAALGPDLVKRGLRFVGIDVIGDYLTEINVTCPTCIQEIDREFGTDIASQLLDAIERDLN